MRRNYSDLAAVDGRRRLNMDVILTALCFVLLFIIVVIPIFMIIYNAFFYEGKIDLSLFISQMTDSKNLAAMWNTLKIALFTTVLGTIMGVFYAWLLGRSDIPMKGLMRALFNIPYMFPPFLGAMAWDMLLNGRSGYLNRFLVTTFHLKGMPFNINSLGGIVFVEVSYYFPFVFMQVVSALERMDPTLEECARIAGAKQRTVIWKITLPLVMIVLISFIKAYGLPLKLENFTLAQYVRVFNANGTIDSIKNSLFASITAGVVCMFLGTLVAYVVQKIRPRGRGALEIISVLPYSIPGTVLSIGVILAWSSALGVTLYNTIWIILVAYMARHLSFSMKTSSAALLQVHSSLEEAARVCGESHTESLTDITLPLIRPAMLSGFFLIFLPAMREVTTSILLYGPYTRTLGVQIYSLRDAGMIPQAAALASVAICLIIVLNAIVTLITKDRKGV